jgi:large subunit ribosomal protein L17
MRHQVKGKKLNRDVAHRKALYKTQLCQLVLNGKLTTTETKAKVIKSQIERLLSKAKDSSLHMRRQLRVAFGNQVVAKIAIDEIAPKLKDKSGGFVKLVRLGRRRGDNTMMSKLELIITRKKRRNSRKRN